MHRHARLLIALLSLLAVAGFQSCTSNKSHSASRRPCSSGGRVTAYLTDDATDKQVNDFADSSMRAGSFARQVVSESSSDPKHRVLRFELCGEATRSEVSSFTRALTDSGIVARTAFKDAPRSASGLTANVKTISSGQAELSGRRTSGEYKVRWNNPRAEAVGAARVTADSERKVRVLDLKGSSGEQLVPIWCGDIDADGRVEVGIQHYGEGDCCRYIAHVVTLGGPTLLKMSGVDLTRSQPDQLDRTTPMEIVADWEAFAFDAYLPTGGLMRMPIVLSYREGKYVEQTRPFRAAIRESLNITRGFLDEDLSRSKDSAEVKTLALGVYGHYVLLGEAERGLRTLSVILTDDTMSWVRAHSDELATRIDETYSD
jgi:hypothetical protein